MEEQIFPGGHLARWEYDKRGKVKKVQVDNHDLVTFTYRRAGLTETRTNLSPSEPRLEQRRLYTYDSRGRLLSDRINLASSYVQRQYTYTLDGDVEVLDIDDNLTDSRFRADLRFTYDRLHRLETAESENAPYRVRLAYTGAGNIREATIAGVQDFSDRQAMVYAYDRTGLTADVQAVHSLTSRLVANQPRLLFAYDRSGNLTTETLTSAIGERPTSYLYDANDQLRRVTKTNGNWEQYYYDHNRRRFLATSSDEGSWRFWMGNVLEFEVTRDSKQWTRIYVQANGEALVRLMKCNGELLPRARRLSLSFTTIDEETLSCCSTEWDSKCALCSWRVW